MIDSFEIIMKQQVNERHTCDNNGDGQLVIKREQLECDGQMVTVIIRQMLENKHTDIYSHHGVYFNL